MNRSRLIAAAALASSVAIPAAAQSLTPPATQIVPRSTIGQTSAADRARPEYQPVGGRIGSFFLYPSLVATGVATDNVFARGDRKRSDTFVTLRADARLQSIFPRHMLNLNAFIDHASHARYITENTTEFGAEANGRIDLRRGTTLDLTALAERLAEPRSSFTALAGVRRPARYGHLLALATARHAPGPVFLESAVSSEAFSFRDSPAERGVVSQQFRSFGQTTGSVTAGFSFRAGIAAVVRAEVDGRDYSLPPASPLQPGSLNRDSTGRRIEGGTRLDLTDRLYGEIGVGHIARDYADPRLRDAAGFGFRGNVLWQAGRRTTVRLQAERRIDEASSAFIAGIRSTGALAEVDQEVRRNITVSGGARYTRFVPLGPIVASDEHRLTLGARYFMNRGANVTLGYNLLRRDDPLPARQFTENRLALAGRLTF